MNLTSSLVFSLDNVVVKPAAVEQLSGLGDVLARYPGDRIGIQGHTDSTGSRAHNEEFSRCAGRGRARRWRIRP